MKEMFIEDNLHIYLRPYEIFITSSTSGMIEFIPDTISIDALKKKFPKGKNWNLKRFFDEYFGDNVIDAQKNFAESLAGYSLFCYVFGVKDRHNGNILLDCKGRLVHIDFGFWLQSSPGGISFEGAPFKLTQEYVDIMDGPDSELFQYFKSLLIKGFFCLRRNLDDIFVMIKIMMTKSKMPCFVRPDTLQAEIRERMSTKYNTGVNNGVEFFELVETLVRNS
jgi:phosphatidylinositol 4-kinase